MWTHSPFRNNLGWVHKQEVDHAHKHNRRVSPNSNSHSYRARTGEQSEPQVTCMSHDTSASKHRHAMVLVLDNKIISKEILRERVLVP